VLITVLTVGGVVSSGLVLWSARARKPPAMDGARRRTIAELGEGCFRVRGGVVLLDSTPSVIDGAACAYVLRASVDPDEGVLREVMHELFAHPFRIEDGTGAIEVDPRLAIIDAPAVQGDAGLVVEQRLRAGEEVELVASFRPCARGCAPYRGAGPLLEPVPSESDPPRVAAVVEPLAAGVPGVDVVLARLAAASVMGASAVLAWLMG